MGNLRLIDADPGQARKILRMFDAVHRVYGEVDYEDLARMVEGADPSRPVYLLTRTEAKDTPGAKWKVARRRVTLNKSFEEAVNEERVAEGRKPTFKAGERAWGRRAGPFLVNDKTGHRYLPVILEAECGTNYFDAAGDQVEANPADRSVRIRKEARRQKIDRPEETRTYSLGSILAIQIPGQVPGSLKGYVVKHKKPQEASS